MIATGLNHIVNATRYSLAGLKVLWRENAARLEVAMYVASLVVLVILGGAFFDYLVMTLLFCVTLSVESTNTALECIVDKLSPEQSDFARDTKDLGSLSVFFLLIANGAYLSAVFARVMGWIIW